MKVYQRIAQLVMARENCINSNNQEWKIKHELEIKRVVKENLPSGGGFDNGTILDLDESTGETLVFLADFHHMNEHGSYDGWTNHKVKVYPSLAFGVSLAVTGKDRNQIKEYISETFYETLTQDEMFAFKMEN